MPRRWISKVGGVETLAASYDCNRLKRQKSRESRTLEDQTVLCIYPESQVGLMELLRFLRCKTC